MPINNLVVEICRTWPSYRRLKKVSKENPVCRLVVDFLPAELQSRLPGPEYELEGSTGRGNITPAPWIATYDKRITRSAIQGFYLVYLFSIDLKRLYLSLAFGVTQFGQYFKRSPERHKQLASAAGRLRTLVDPKRILHAEPLDLAATPRNRLHFDYEYSNIFAVPYDLDQLSGDHVLIADYRYMLGLYAQLVENPLLPTMQQLLEAQISPPAEVLPPKVTEFTRRAPSGKKREARAEEGITRISRESKKVGDRGEQVVYDYELAKIQKLGEWGAALKHGAGYFIYVVTNVLKKRPTIEIICDPIALVREDSLRLELASVLIGLVPRENETRSLAADPLSLRSAPVKEHRPLVKVD
jgi:hypothetical protein